MCRPWHDCRAPFLLGLTCRDVSRVQSDIDAQLFNLMQSPAQRDLARVLRGYDTHQVDEILRRLDAELDEQRAQARLLQQELEAARLRLQEQERPAESRLGSRIEQLIQGIEEEAAEIIGEARAAAADTTLAAEADAALLRAGGRNEAAELRASAQREADSLRASAESEIQIIKSGARNEADAITDVARSEAETMKAEAQREADEIKRRDAGASAQAEQIRDRARKDAHQMVTNARANADELVAEARRLLAEARMEADRIAAEARRQVEELNEQGSSVAAQLAQISQLLGPPAGGGEDDPAEPSAASVPAAAGEEPGGPECGRIRRRARRAERDRSSRGRRRVTAATGTLPLVARPRPVMAYMSLVCMRGHETTAEIGGNDRLVGRCAAAAALRELPARAAGEPRRHPGCSCRGDPADGVLSALAVWSVRADVQARRAGGRAGIQRRGSVPGLPRFAAELCRRGHVGAPDPADRPSRSAVR